MGTNYAPLITNLFLYSYKREFMQKLVKDKQITEDKCFNLTFKYNGDVLSINNPNSAFWITLISYFL
jgi:hypothetical protein